MEELKHKTYSWSIGTTSFRVAELKYYIEKQLLLIKGLSKDETYNQMDWGKEKQAYYAEELTSEGIFEITKTPEKDARVKTSSLVELGLLDEKREITEVGNKIIEIESNIDEVKLENIFGIREDSYTYVKQLLKLQASDEEFKIRPLSAFIYSLIKKGNKMDENILKYIIPQCKTKEELDEALKRNQDPQKYVMERVKKDTPRELELMINSSPIINEEFLMKILPNRKSREYSRPAAQLYFEIKNYWTSINNSSNDEKFSKIKNLKIGDISKKSKSQTSQYLFGKERITNNVSKEEVIKYFENSELMKSKTEKELIVNYYYLYSYASRLSNLEEYLDLNKRYFKFTDLFIFDHGSISMEIVPFYFFKDCVDKLIEEPLLKKEQYKQKMYSDIELNKIYPSLNLDYETLRQEIKNDYPEIDINENTMSALKKFNIRKRKERFDKMIDEKFKIESIIKILKEIKNNSVKSVQTLIECEADLPTIFEYIIGISWHILNNKRGDLYETLNLYLDANLLPQRFAGGGKPDIVFTHKDHDQIIEVTLSTQDNQRRMELEPVIRHLGNHLLNSKKDGYAIFIAPYLDPNVLVAFRAYKYNKWYNKTKTENYINGLKIIPLDIENMIKILSENYNYEKLYSEFNIKIQSPEKDGLEWYKKEINSSYS